MTPDSTGTAMRPFVAPATAGIGVALILLVGCPTDAPDDDAADDDDTTHGDDDDSAVDPLCDYGDGWATVGLAEDAQGDADGYLIDLQAYQWQWDGGMLWMRLTTHGAFDTDDPALMVDMYLSDGTTHYTLTYDNVNPNPEPLQIWSSIDDWASPLDSPPSLRFCEDGEDSIVLAIDPADLGFDGVDPLAGYGAANIYGDTGYVDLAPDAGLTGFPLDPGPVLTLAAMTVDDSGGDGDGVVNPGEALALAIELHNGGYQPSGTHVTGTLGVDPASTTAATITVDSVSFGGGTAIVAFASAPADAAFELSVDGAAQPGEMLLLDLALTDDDGNSWTVDLPPLAVAMIPVVTDDDDFDPAFDIASVQYLTDGSHLTLLITSHGAHAADQQVNFYCDTDLDGSMDFAVSTLDEGAGDFGGGVYFWDDTVGWVEFASPVTYQYDAGSAYALYSVSLADLGDPILIAGYALALGTDGYAADYAPDDVSSLLTQAIIPLVATPYILLGGRTLSEQSGDGDPFADPGEVWRVQLEVRNIGGGASAVTSGTLSSSDPEITIQGGNVQFGATPSGGSATAATQPMLVIDAGADPAGIHTLHLLVDADGYSFDLSFPVLLGLQAADLATDALEIPGSQTLTGDTSPLADDYANPSACTGWSADGSDAVYAVSLTGGQLLELTLAFHGGGPDATLYVSDDPVSPDIHCLAGADDNVDHTESLSFTAPTGGLYYVVVDSFDSGSGGPYTLDVAF